MLLSKVISPPRAGRRIVGLIRLCLMASGVPNGAHAQTLQEQQLEQTGLVERTPKTWNVFLGAVVASTNTYEGSESRRVHGAPFFLIAYRDELFLGPLGLSWKAIDWNGFRAGPVLGLMGGRRQDLSPHLFGLGDISSSVAVGFFANYRLDQFQLSTNFRQAVTHTGNGWLGLVQLDYRTALIAHRAGFFIGPEAQFASAKYEQTFFGVTGAQSVDSGLPQFTPPGGLKDYGVHAGITYVWTRHVVMRVFVDEKWLGNDIKDSPIVLRNTETLVGVAAAYHF